MFPPSLERQIQSLRNLNSISGLSDPYVKFKLDGRTAYKSKVCKETLNPRWDEEFQISLHIHSEVYIRVYDRDRGLRDDFMGGGRLDLLRLNNEFESVTISLEDPNSDEDLGYIHFEAKVVSVIPEVSSFFSITSLIVFSLGCIFLQKLASF